ncbi:MAG: hypothetical protein M3P49_13865 [Actinomycetota bacterium]|nr:hypothetical protein [Actinomycetota bacterium]
MKESARAARDEIAHNRCVVALKSLVGENHEKVRELEDLKAQRLSAPVAGMMEREIMAEILEVLERSQRVGNFVAALKATEASSPPQKEASEGGTDLRTLEVPAEWIRLLVPAGYETGESVAEASDEELLAIKGVGEATLKDLRDFFNADRTRDTPDGLEAVG